MLPTPHGSIDIDQILATGPWFAELPSDIATEVRRLGRLASLNAGTSLFQQDGPPSGLHAVMSGELRIVALTANAISGMMELFLSRGMNDFISKPIELDKLTRVLETWLPPEKVAGGHREGKRTSV